MLFTIQPLGNIVGLGEQAYVARSINRSVTTLAVAKELRERHLLGVIKSYGTTETESLHAVYKARKLHQDRKLGVFVLRNADDVVGLAMLDPDPSLRRQKYKVQPRIAKLGGTAITRPVVVHGPKITVWIDRTVDSNADEHLTEVYRALKNPTGIGKRNYDMFRAAHWDISIDSIAPWTIEPGDNGSHGQTPIHRAIVAAGFINALEDQGHYDDGESRRSAPPHSRLYIAVARGPAA